MPLRHLPYALLPRLVIFVGQSAHVFSLVTFFFNVLGIWEFPLNSHYTESFEGGYCPYMDQCVLQNMDEQDVLEWLKEDFARYYDGNRAVFESLFLFYLDIFF